MDFTLGQTQPRRASIAFKSGPKLKQKPIAKQIKLLMVLMVVKVIGGIIPEKSVIKKHGKTKAQRVPVELIHAHLIVLLTATNGLAISGSTRTPTDMIVKVALSD